MSGNIVTFPSYSEKSDNQYREYKHEFRSEDQRWKNRKHQPINAAILGISSGSPYVTSGSKLDSCLHAIYKQTDHLFISNTYSPYQYSFMAEGLDAETALTKAKEHGNAWIENNRELLEHYQKEASTQGKSLTIIDWISDIRNHPNYTEYLVKAHGFFHQNQNFHDSIEQDVASLLKRKIKREKGKNAISYIKPFFLKMNTKSALEKITGYWIMTEMLQKKTGENLVSYFYNGPVSPQINFFRTHADDIPENMIDPLKSIIYVDITFRKRNQKAA